MKYNIIPYSRKELLDRYNYDKLTGLLSVKIRYNNYVKIGQILGNKVNLSGSYPNISLCNKKYLLHRVIYKIINDYFDESKVIDHIDGDYLNNRPENLRLVTQHDNCKNCKLSKNNKSGYNGVYYDKSRKKWHAMIKNKYKTISLGRFTKIENAIQARKNAEIKYKYHDLHGTKI